MFFFYYPITLFVHHILPYNREGERIANESSGAPSKRSSKRQETPISLGGMCIGEREGVTIISNIPNVSLHC
jgi:hypothetical protein